MFSCLARAAGTQLRVCIRVALLRLTSTLSGPAIIQFPYDHTCMQVPAAQLLEATAAKHGITLGRSPGHLPDFLPQTIPSHLNYENFPGMGQPQQLSTEQNPRFPQGFDQPQAEQRGGGLVHQSTLPIHIIRQLQSQAAQQQQQQQSGPAQGLASARSLSDPNLFQMGRNAEAALDPRQDGTAPQVGTPSHRPLTSVHERAAVLAVLL